MKKATVFLSHSSQDKPTAIQLAKELKNRGIDVWIDHEQIKLGDSIPSRISEGLSTCCTILVLLSTDFATSSWCRSEYEPLIVKEINEGRTYVIPVRLDDSEIPMLLSSKRYVDLRRGLEEYMLEELCEAILDGASQKALMLIEISEDVVPSKDASLLGLVISSIIDEYPVSRMTAERLASGASLVDLYRAVDTLIDRFQNMFDGLAAIFTNYGHRLDYHWANRHSIQEVATANRKLLRTAREMREISDSLSSLLSSDSALRERLTATCRLCAIISEVEGTLTLKFGSPLQVPSDDSIGPRGLYGRQSHTPGMPIQDTEFTWDFGYRWSEMNLQLARLEDYRADLRTEIAKAMSESK